MQFLNPIWFSALAALAIPLVIHLWNIKPGRVLKVGSISLISEASRKSSRSFKLTDIPLLMLRCLLLALIAFLLAQPFLQQQLKTKKPAGWVLFPREDFKVGYTQFKKPIDSLLQKGYEFHFFNDSFPKVDLANLIKQKDTSLSKPGNAADNYWSLIRELDAKVAADVPIYLYTSNERKHFAGDKPEADLNLHWQTYATADSSAQWVQSAWFSNDKTISVVKGKSNPSGIRFDYTTIQSEKGDDEYKVDVKNGRAVVSLSQHPATSFTVDTSAVHIAIYTDHFQDDAKYLKAALEAAGQFSRRRYSIKVYGNGSPIPSEQNWVFWLSEQAVPTRLFDSNADVFIYQKGKQNLAATNMVSAKMYALPSGNEQTAIFKTISVNQGGEAIWRDGYGNALLSSIKKGNAMLYKFQTRFSPAYNDLVWSSVFPQLMLQLVFGGTAADFSKFDRRKMSADEMMPVKTSQKTAIAKKFAMQKELAFYFWIALALLFFAERWLATSNKVVEANG
ncbi:BatA domain-containing protein [Mucilaginibacter ginkgonis]|uniref:BatA domain-containing protein n=1 Tax=Mucilaginibacter ginkgonis TaxID=2682091 RepID=A0A6I4HX43_9SPHI|nr:BatA domain-containing protein [Mucilaginibacter ginkgonis]QQL49816.1 BatA domain-containing protein [Mucilaginibacter ginkgonis]